LRQLFIYALVFFWAIFPLTASQIDSVTVNDLIRFRMEAEVPGDKIMVREEAILTTEDVIAFYNKREFKEAWSKKGILTEQAYELRFEIKQSEFDGLTPRDYNLQLIESFFSLFEANKANGIKNAAGDLADLDIFLSDAFFHLAEDLERGKVDPSSIKGSWEIARKAKVADYPVLLSESIKNESIRKGLESLYPKFSIYKKGREVIRELAVKVKEDTLNWKRVKVDKSMRVGEKNNAIPAIRERLIYWEFLEPYLVEDQKLYDSLMFDAIRDFQGTNGIDIDGVIGSMTASAFNDSPKDRLDKAAVNMERLRWLPDTVKNAEFIVVNIANFQLDYINKLDTVFSERVIVGKRYHESPIFMAEMSYIVFSPYWNIPYSITRGEVIPGVKKNPNYLSARNMEVVTTSGKVVDPSTIDWSSKSFPYMVRQKPGPHNSLGLVKFMFPNKYNVYIHDTNARSLFSLDDRARSHGCIRVQNPQDLAKALLSKNPAWTAARIESAMGQSQEQVVKLDKKIPVVLVYLTFWADSKGEAHFRDDIYERDEEVLTALRQ